MSRLAILGAGAFGTALAIALARGGAAVSLIARDPEAAARIEKARENAGRLPGATLPEAVSVTADTAAAEGADAILLTVPMQRLTEALSAARTHLAKGPLVAACKGMDLATLKGATALLAEARPEGPHALLTGPSFAADIARGLPTALTLACADEAAGLDLQHLLSTPTLRLYRTTDTVGAELGGAVKNVIAIAAGATIGAGLGDSARAALMTRGYAEMLRLAPALGARPETLAGLSGFGDLVLTCTSEQSRNFRYGLALGRGEAFAEDVTVEGAATSRAVARLAAERDIDVPITDTVAALAEGRLTLKGAMDTLLARPLKEE
ncbi:MAG: NAD(P)-dependent glycerol-3-phosphate dehydrogenase [Paracoccaceae bacterium]|nr:NAD(P)-dependent glycerol-3-phosphate dehydrogenase [Paracoccaceae bacterium]